MRLLPNFLRKLLGRLTQEENVRFWEEFYKTPQESRYPKHWNSISSHQCQFCQKDIICKKGSVQRIKNHLDRKHGTIMCPDCVNSIKKTYFKRGK